MDFSQIFTAIVLGIVEGITEFLPISSTGHLIIFNEWFNFPSESFTKMFDIVIQTGAILAVVVFFRTRIFPVFKTQTIEDRKNIGDLWIKALIGFLPAVGIGLVGHDFIEKHLMNLPVVATTLIVWGAIIIVVEYRALSQAKAGVIPRFETVRSLTIPLVLAIGLIQCLGMVPGTSRSAATIVGAMLLGASRVAAAEFSFFLAIPTLLGAGAYSLFKELKSGFHFGSAELITLATGTIVSFLVAWLVVAAFMNFIKKHDFRGFGWYRIALGLALVAWIVLRGHAQ